ncbi:helix-turn-helix transcriptional regulator [Nocardiopsis sp. NPDC006139]|uniref:helix-turn-helix transcriptional regulator n=1 Tax=Nocardiopsis TaxID=2013 RepID=UPI0033B2B8B5
MALAHLPSGSLVPRVSVLVRAALGRARRTTGLPVLFGGTAAPERTAVRLTEIAGARTDALRGLVIRGGSGLGGRVLVTGRPGSVDDYVADRRISHEYDAPVGAEGLRAVAAVPVVVAGSVAALLYGGVREPLPIGARTVAALEHAASRLAAELAVRAEVERRVAGVETAEITRAARDPRTGPDWERLREAHAELRAIAQEVTDPELRDRLRGVCDRLSGPAPGRAPAPALAPREVDVLALVAVGCGNAEVGRRLGLGAETVKSYLRGAMRKLGTHTRMETVVAARRAGLLP